MPRRATRSPDRRAAAATATLTFPPDCASPARGNARPVHGCWHLGCAAHRQEERYADDETFDSEARDDQEALDDEAGDAEDSELHDVREAYRARPVQRDGRARPIPCVGSPTACKEDDEVRARGSGRPTTWAGGVNTDDGHTVETLGECPECRRVVLRSERRAVVDGEVFHADCFGVRRTPSSEAK